MMKAGQRLFSILALAIIGMNWMPACSDNGAQEGADFPVVEEVDYPVAGIWHASASWHEIFQSTLLGQTHEFDDLYQLDVYFDFREDGTLLNKRTLSMNGIEWEDDLTHWTILNLTWTVAQNVITLSNGKQYVIVDDRFDDLYPDDIILQFEKEN